MTLSKGILASANHIRTVRTTMVIYSPVPLKPQSMMNGVVISIPFLVIGKSSSQMCSHKAELRVSIVHPDGHSSLIPCHTRHASFLDRALDILDIAKHR